MGGHQRLSQVGAVHELTGGHYAGLGGAQGGFHVTDLTHHGGKLVRQQRNLVVVTFKVAVNSEVLFDHRRAQGHRSHGDVVATLVTGVAHRAVTDLS